SLSPSLASALCAKNSPCWCTNCSPEVPPCSPLSSLRPSPPSSSSESVGGAADLQRSSVSFVTLPLTVDPSFSVIVSTPPVNEAILPTASPSEDVFGPAGALPVFPDT